MSLKASDSRHGGVRNKLLDLYIASLLTRPLLTKSCTSAILSFLQELLASKLADEAPTITPTGISIIDYAQSMGVNAKVVKLSAYGGLISAPISHALMKIINQLFPDREYNNKSKLGAILASLFITTPIQNSVYLVAIAIIEGAKSKKEIFFFWKKTIGILTKLSVVIGMISTTIANKFIPKELWIPFFNLISFIIGTYLNFLNKQKRKFIMKKKKDLELNSSNNYKNDSINSKKDIKNHLDHVDNN